MGRARCVLVRTRARVPAVARADADSCQSPMLRGVAVYGVHCAWSTAGGRQGAVGSVRCAVEKIWIGKNRYIRMAHAYAGGSPRRPGRYTRRSYPWQASVGPPVRRTWHQMCARHMHSEHPASRAAAMRKGVSSSEGTEQEVGKRWTESEDVGGDTKPVNPHSRRHHASRYLTITRCIAPLQ